MPVHDERIASDGFEDVSAECARKAIVSMKNRKLSEQWSELSRAMSTTELLMSENAIRSDKDMLQRLTDDMCEIMDIFDVLYAYTESILPKTGKGKSSRISDPWELDLYRNINNRLHVMDGKRDSFIRAMKPEGLASS